MIEDEEYVPGQPARVKVEPYAEDEDPRVIGWRWMPIVIVGCALLAVAAVGAAVNARWIGPSTVPAAVASIATAASTDEASTVTETVMGTLHVTATESAVVTSRVSVPIVQTKVRTVVRREVVTLPAQTSTATVTSRVVVPTTATVTRTLPRATVRVTRTLPRATVTRVIVAGRSGR